MVKHKCLCNYLINTIYCVKLYNVHRTVLVLHRAPCSVQDFLACSSLCVKYLVPRQKLSVHIVQPRQYISDLISA